jgi:hypothetical protein
MELSSQALDSSYSLVEPDENNPNYVFAAIEAGALVQSRDGGRTLIDRVEQGPYDTHTLATHPKAPKRLYCSAVMVILKALITENHGIGQWGV